MKIQIKLLIILVTMLTCSFVVAPITEYEDFLDGAPLAFSIDVSNTYTFIKMQTGVNLYVNDKIDGKFNIIYRKANNNLTLENSWGQFRLLFLNGELTSIIHEVYANKKLNIDHFSITYEL